MMNAWIVQLLGIDIIYKKHYIAKQCNFRENIDLFQFWNTFILIKEWSQIK